MSTYLNQDHFEALHFVSSKIKFCIILSLSLSFYLSLLYITFSLCSCLKMTHDSVFLCSFVWFCLSLFLFLSLLLSISVCLLIFLRSPFCLLNNKVLHHSLSLSLSLSISLCCISLSHSAPVSKCLVSLCFFDSLFMSVSQLFSFSFSFCLFLYLCCETPSIFSNMSNKYLG